MTKSTLFRVMSSAPVDATARMVASQVGCSDDWLATVRNLKEINDLLHERRQELKERIGVNHHMFQLKIREEYQRLERAGQEPPPIMREYVTLGRQIHRINQEYARIMKENNAEASHGAKSRAAKRELMEAANK